MTYRVVIAATEPGFPDYRREREVLEPIGASIEAHWCHTEAEVIAWCKDADAILTNHAPFTATVIEQLRQCKVIVRYGIGYDNIDTAAAARQGIPVVNVPDYGIQEVADHTMAMMLGAVRRIPRMDRNVRSGDWAIGSLGSIPGLGGKTLGLAGFGNIAREVARRAQGFHLEVIAYDPYVGQETFEAMGVHAVDFETLLARSDLLSLHMPLMEATKRLFGRRTLSQMKRTAVIVNTSRGGVIDTDDLVQALLDGTIAGAALDVFEEEPLKPDHPLLTMEQCLLSPHAAWYSESSVDRLQHYAALEVGRVLSGERAKHVVNGV
ncbi:2-hydroxyacid dehydrogenase [Paenibacillus sp. 598K]|uniref:C-terminal binding protein n=1 Tax=Paenibacillus sp. 598K TaxID=1117987 RepID=UPI000FF9635E|nr:C-terminal binding protein [Paenibacillus sp. 598K]GBF75692.1 2-hydroxyacid dehydrogenase [Paenibacillus sp. 598K]